MFHAKHSKLRLKTSIVLWISSLAVSGYAWASAWDVRILPEFASYPDISGNYVAYTIFDGDDDVRLYDISDDTVTNVTNSYGYERYVSVSGPRVAWHDVSGDAIKLYDHSVGTTTTLDHGGTFNGRSNPRISGNSVVWEKDLGLSFYMHEIFLYHGGTVRRVTSNTYEDTSCQIDGNHVVWAGKKNGTFDVFFYDIASQSTTQITDNNLNDTSPRVCGVNVVWMAYDGQDSEIFYYNITTGVTKQITNNVYYDIAPVVSNNRIAWCGSDGSDSEIFLYDISAETTLQITDNDADDRNIDISDELLVWRKRVEGYFGGEVFAYDGTGVTRLSLADSWSNDNTRVDGWYVCWNGWTSNGRRVFVAIPQSNATPVADAGSDQVVEAVTSEGSQVILDGSGSTDSDSTPGTNDDIMSFDWYEGDTFLGSGEILDFIFPIGTHLITLVVTDSDDEIDSDEVVITIQDTTPPEVEITFPLVDLALQDVVTLAAEAFDISGVAEVGFFIREPDGDSGIPIGYEDIPGTFTDAQWAYSFDTTVLPNGYYVIFAKAIDDYDNESWSDVIPFSIWNWAAPELLPVSESNKAGRMMPIKFSLRIDERVDPEMPFVYNEELEVKIYNTADPGIILHTAVYGDTSRDYRIDTAAELYITNFKTEKQSTEYMVEILRLSEDFLIGSFTFETVR